MKHKRLINKICSNCGRYIYWEITRLDLTQVVHRTKILETVYLQSDCCELDALRNVSRLTLTWTCTWETGHIGIKPWKKFEIQKIEQLFVVFGKTNNMRQAHVSQLLDCICYNSWRRNFRWFISNIIILKVAAKENCFQGALWLSRKTLKFAFRATVWSRR